jgi:hypothetical protein
VDARKIYYWGEDSQLHYSYDYGTDPVLDNMSVGNALDVSRTIHRGHVSGETYGQYTLYK